ncbi:hypothetical protein EMPS_05355 [Entomortierella parvispora]|uniref:Uncharacterized protein n=1 Tax=Entomortierella parvispora TaxID=205924 RepID=A0A9P3LWF0_9FUNG|nr:hypothetical protein EMPS_05355 [Entomortierella parvispora]
MHLSLASIALIVVSAIGVVSAADEVSFGICTCFNPKYDASCCILAQGYQMNDGNVCDTLDFGPSVQKYKDCCARSGGRVKCKIGNREPSHWPPEDSYGCKA